MLPLSAASIRDLCETTDHLYTSLEYGEKIYLHNVFQTYTYNNESVILVDTSIAREVRLCQTLGDPAAVQTDILGLPPQNSFINCKRSVVIKDITGLADQHPVLITLIGGTVTLQGTPVREFQLYVPWGSLELMAHGRDWVITVPRSTCISSRGFRLPQNLNLALPPAVGATRESFGAIAFFPVNMVGIDTVPPTYNGFSGSVHSPYQIPLGDPVTSSLSSLFLIPDPPVTSGKEFSDLSISTTTSFNIPGDFNSLAAAFTFLSNKFITPSVTVNLNLVGPSAITNLLVLNHPQSSRIVVQGLPLTVLVPVSTQVFSIVPGAVLMDVFIDTADFSAANFQVGDLIVIDQTTALYQRWTGAWPIVSTTLTSIRIQITDWGANFPLTALFAQQTRFRLLNSLVTVTGTGAVQIYGDGLTFNNVGFVGAGNAPTGLTCYGIVNLNTVAFTNFVLSGVSVATRGGLNTQDLFACSNQYGIYLEKQGILNADYSPNSTATYLNGNVVGLAQSRSAISKLNPLYAVGNQQFGVSLERHALADLYNSVILANGTGLSATMESTATGNSNIIAGNVMDITVSGLSLVKMPGTSALTLATPNKTLNPDGSLIDLG